MRSHSLKDNLDEGSAGQLNDALDAETVEEYRQKVVDAFQLEPQGGGEIRRIGK